MLVVAITLAALALFPSCSSNNSSPGITCPGATGSFNNSSLASGTQYAYQLSGWFVNVSGTYSPYTEAGYFTVDGKGNVTGGFDDYFGSSAATSGNYAIIANGTGTVNLNITTSTGVQQLTWGITLANPGNTPQVASFSIIEGDTFANASGTAYAQNASLLGTAPSGTFVFRTHVTTSGTSVSGAQSSVGIITFTGASVGGSDDWVNGGIASGNFANFSGTLAAPTGGLGSFSFSDGLGARTFDYFVIDANTLLLYETDTNGGLGLGRAEMQQSPGAYTNASFNGSYVFGSRGDTTSSAADGVDTVGQFGADGAGNVSGGTIDRVTDGSAQIGGTISAGTYTLDTSGRIVTALGTSSVGTLNDVIYLVSPSRAFFLVDNVNSVEDGTMDLQTTGSFSTSTFSGQYAFVMGGSTGGPVITTGLPLDRTGTVQSDGNGNLGWAEQVNSGGSGNAVCLSGTYTVSTNGRVLGSVNTLSTNLVFYLISGSGGYALQGDAGAQMLGGLVNQSQPIPVIPGGI